MPFNYTDLQGTDKIKDMFPKVNDIGNYLKEEYNNGNIPGYTNVDLDNILDKITEKGDYYVSAVKNAPKGESSNGFLRFDKRTNNYYKLYYTPYHTNNLYIRTMFNGSLSEWTKVKMDDGGIVDVGRAIDVTTLNESTTQYANIIDFPNKEINNGWLNFTKGKNNLSIAEFNPINSTSTYKKIQKQQKQTQNPNILEDATFRETIKNENTITSLTDTGFWESYNKIPNPVTGVEYQGQKVVQLYSEGSNYPSIISKPYEIGKDINIGDTLTLSAYIYVPDSSILDNRTPYLDISGYDSLTQSRNPTIGQYEVTTSNVKYGQWQRISVTAKVPSANIEGKPIKYIKALLRYNCSNNNNTSKPFYYALPKLEKSDTPTPFISNSKDNYQFDEIWTQWEEYKNTRTLNKTSPTDITNNGFFDYVWDERASGVSFQTLVNTVPQGLHTFYCHNSIPGAPSSTDPVRGTILIDHITGDNSRPTRGVIQCTDAQGRAYTYYKHDTELTLTSQLQGATFLWEGKLDLADTNTTVPLAEDPSKFDYIDISYTIKLNGTDQTGRYFMGAGTSNFVIRGFNLSDTGGAGIDFWEGTLTFTGKTLKPARSHRVSYLTSTNTTSAHPLNTKGEIFIYKVVGIKSI